jgi:hypothetical protein
MFTRDECHTIVKSTSDIVTQKGNHQTLPYESDSAHQLTAPLSLNMCDYSYMSSYAPKHTIQSQREALPAECLLILPECSIITDPFLGFVISFAIKNQHLVKKTTILSRVEQLNPIACVDGQHVLS